MRVRCFTYGKRALCLWQLLSLVSNNIGYISILVTAALVTIIEMYPMLFNSNPLFFGANVYEIRCFKTNVFSMRSWI